MENNQNFLSLLKPQNVFQNKLRLGPQEDGGYVSSEFVLDNCSALFTYGVGHDTRYEEDFVKKYNKPVYLFDHTLGHASWERDLMKFTPEGLGTTENCAHVYEHCQRFNITEPILLKVDVEGYEYEYFDIADIQKISDLAMGLLLEVHWIDGTTQREGFINIMNKLSPYFVLNHVHSNVWGGQWEYEGLTVPKVLELSFVNKKYVQNSEPDTQDYPIQGLDFSNNPNVEDFKLEFLKHV
jgi:hypothetical protein